MFTQENISKLKKIYHNVCENFNEGYNQLVKPFKNFLTIKLRLKMNFKIKLLNFNN